MKIDIVLHPSGDWEGLYIDNKLVTEGHSISVEDLVTQLNTYFDREISLYKFGIDYDQWEGDIKKEKHVWTNSDGDDIDEWEDYPSNMPDELPERL